MKEEGKKGEERGQRTRGIDWMDHQGAPSHELCFLVFKPLYEPLLSVDRTHNLLLINSI